MANYLIILAAAAVNFIFGALWYSPLLFGKMWTAALGKSEEEVKQSRKTKVFTLWIIASLVLSYFLARFVSYTGAFTFGDGMMVGFWVWLGFIAAGVLPVYLFEVRPMKLYFLYIIYQLIALVLMGGVIARWS